MTLFEIRAFLATLKYSNMSAAAESLCITQPALSRRINSLEEELGYRLFERNKGVRSITLTEEGTAFVAVAEKWMRIYQEAQAISTLKQKPMLNIGSILSVSNCILGDVIRDIVSPLPPISAKNKYNISLANYHSYESYKLIEDRIIDIAFISDDMYHQTVTTTPAFSSPYVLAGGPAWEYIHTVNPKQLNPANEIRFSWSNEYDTWHQKYFDVSVYPKLSLDQIIMLSKYLVGENYAIMPAAFIPAIKSDLLHFISLTDGPQDHMVYYLTNSSDKPELIHDFLLRLNQKLSTIDQVHSFLFSCK